MSGNKLLTATLNVPFDDNVRELRAMYTSAVLPNGTALGTIINRPSEEAALGQVTLSRKPRRDKKKRQIRGNGLRPTRLFE